MQLSGAEIICECLLEQGVDTVFGYPGGAALNTYDALYKYSDRINHILTAHEQGASHAADGYARATGKTGVVITTSGPGATNIVTGIATANIDSIPVVAITGNVTTDQLGRDSFQEVDIVNIVKPITKASFLVEKVEDLAPTLRKAFEIAQSGRKGPVLVDVPKDVTANKTEFEVVKPKEVERVSIKNPENICGRCPHPQPLKRLTKLLTLGRKVWLLLYFVARLKLSKMSLEYFTQKLPLSISQGELII
jgi:acetolactate synthase I/II/III large subunit